MSKNIKEIGKELLGKSLNSFHRKTGLTQLEKNNEMQDGILDGILSQVDNAYIEKTEQSNVIHLDGSGDGVVVLDSIEGNTMVNHINSQSLRDWTYSHITHTGQYANTQEFGIDWSKEVSFNCWLQARNDSNPIFYTLKPNTDYTVWINILENNPTLDNVPVTNCIGALQLWINGYQSVRQDLPINTTGWVSFNYRWIREDNNINYSIFGLSILGTNSDGTKTINGGKLRISKEVIVLEGVDKPLDSYFEGLQSSFEEKVNDEGKYEIEILMKNKNLFDGKLEQGAYNNAGEKITNGNYALRSVNKIKVNPNTTYTFSMKDYTGTIYVCEYHNDTFIKQTNVGSTRSITTNPLTNCITFNTSNNGNSLPVISDIQLETGNRTSYVPNKQNKIKLLINEPLRAIGDVKDRLCINNGKLVVERYCDVREYQEGDLDLENVLTDMTNTIYLLDEIFYEEVTNEYGEPILLEGYENGTLYIDSTIIPTTTVRYTPKMESFKTLKEVENNNIMLTNDVNDNIIPYMMDVDLMIMEKEMALMSHKNIRKMEVLDMTSMQKRTQDMLERLIKGKTLTEQECKTRVTTYLHAGKITDEQAEELMLLIDEVYA